MTRRLDLPPRTISRQPVWDEQKTESSTQDHIKTTSLKWPENWIFHRGPYQDNQFEMTRRLRLPPRTISRQRVWDDQKTESSTEDHIKTASMRWPEDWVFHRGPSCTWSTQRLIYGSNVATFQGNPSPTRNFLRVCRQDDWPARRN